MLQRPSPRFVLSIATLILLSIPSDARAQTAVSRWQHLLRPVSPGERSPGVLAARELADGTVMIVTDALIAYRYDHDGSPVSAAALRASASRPARDPASRAAEDLGEGGSSLPGYGRAFAAIDPFGVVATARLGDPDFRAPLLTFRGDIVTDLFDGLTGKSLWGTAVVYDTGTNRPDYPTGVFLDQNGDVFVTGVSAGGGGMTHVALKYRKTDGSLAWGPQLIQSAADVGTAALAGSGDLWVSVPSNGITTVLYDGGTGTILFGPLTSDVEGFERPRACAVDPQGDLVVVGGSEEAPLAIKYTRTPYPGGIAWGPVLYEAPDGAESFDAIAIDASGGIFAAGRAPDGSSQTSELSISKLAGSNGARTWRIVADPEGALDPSAVVTATGNGDAILSALSRAGGETRVGHWRFRGSDGAPAWGPSSVGESLDDVFAPFPPFVSIVASNGRIFSAARIVDDPSVTTKVFELDGASGVPVWGPTPIAALPIAGGRLQDLAGGADGSIAVVGDTLDGSMVTYKYSRDDGTPLWGPVVLPSASGFQAQVDASGNIIVLAGGVSPFGGTSVIKYAAANGAVLWGPVSVDGGNPQGLALDSTGNPIVIFWTTAPGGASYDAGVAKVDGATGAVAWGPVFYDSGADQDDFVRALSVSPSGDVFVVGDTWPQGSPIHWFVLKYAGSDGAVIWGGDVAIEGQPFGASSDAAGNLAVTGGGTAKFDGGTGSILWGPVSLPGSSREGRAIGVGAGGDVFVFGTIDQNLATARYDGADGHVVWGPVLFDGEAHSFDIAYDLGLGFDGQGNVVVGGYSRTPARNYDLVTFKYDGTSGATLWGPVYVGSYDEERMTGFSVADGSVVVGASSQGGLLFAGLDEQFGIRTMPPDPTPAACNVPYAFSFAGANGTTPYAWNVSSGDLPDGLLLSTTGILSGVPVGTGTFAFEVEAADSANHTVTRTFELVVGEGNLSSFIEPISHDACSVDLTVIGTWESYFWLPGEQTTPSINVAPTESTTYGVIVSDASGCVQHLGIVVPGTILQDPDCLAPGLETVAPDSGPASGTAVGLTGVHFANGAAVWIGGAAATDVVVVGPTSITATTPALAPGTLNDVAVVNPDGGNAALLGAFMANFMDVPDSDAFHDDVTTLIRNAITAGCGGGNYCPADPVSRAQMAVFLLKSRYGAAYVPPPAIGIFLDVPAGDPFAPWIERLHDLGVTAGCGGDDYCPSSPVTRSQMAVLLLKTKNGAAYVPPGAIGVFADVPVSDPFAAWIENLYGYGITGGCSASPLLYCPGSSVTRGQMSAFLVRTFGLQ